MKPKAKKFILFAPFALAGVVVFIAIGGEVVRLLWNWLLPPLFGWPEITFWQALGLLLLCRILFGGRTFHLGSRSGAGRRFADRIADRVTERVAERWEHMTPEERERLRQRMRERWGFDPPSGESREPT
jgi:hypothetical protein